jgi:hypothetical protein
VISLKTRKDWGDNARERIFAACIGAKLNRLLSNGIFEEKFIPALRIASIYSIVSNGDCTRSIAARFAEN